MGTRGAAGAPPTRYPGNTDLKATPGEEGGALTLIARSVALGGLVTAVGGTPSQGQSPSSAGRIPGAHLYAVMSNGTVFASDGSRAVACRMGWAIL
jgi:hypothetical protein